MHKSTSNKAMALEQWKRLSKLYMANMVFVSKFTTRLQNLFALVYSSRSRSTFYYIISTIAPYFQNKQKIRLLFIIFTLSNFYFNFNANFKKWRNYILACKAYEFSKIILDWLSRKLFCENGPFFLWICYRIFLDWSDRQK